MSRVNASWLSLKLRAILVFSPAIFSTQILARPAPKYCPECLSEDLRLYGRPIIHVPHQIPDVTVCHKHGIRLTETPDKAIIERGTELEILYAVFTHDLYQERIVGSINNIAGFLRDPKTYDRIPVFQDVLKKNGFQDFQTYSKEIYFTVRNKCYDTSVVRVAAELFPVSVFKDSICKTREKEIDACRDQLLKSSHNLDIVDDSYPFVSVYCSDCKRQYTMYFGSIQAFPSCAICDTVLPKEQQIDKFIRLATHNEYSLSKMISGKTVVICHNKCGTIKEQRYTPMLFSKCACPKCSPHIGETNVMHNGMRAEIID